MGEQTGNQNSQKKGGNKAVIIVGVVAVVIIAILIGVIVYLLKPEEEPERNVVVTPENVEQVIEQMEEDQKVPVGAYEVTQNTEWIFADGKSVSSNAFVENSTANTNMVYFVITLADTGEEVYVSPYLAIGSQLREIALDKPLEKGDYNVIITYHLVDDDFNDLSQVSMSMKIIVEN